MCTFLFLPFIDFDLPFECKPSVYNRKQTFWVWKHLNNRSHSMILIICHHSIRRYLNSIFIQSFLWFCCSLTQLNHLEHAQTAFGMKRIKILFKKSMHENTQHLQCISWFPAVEVKVPGDYRVVMISGQAKESERKKTATSNKNSFAVVEFVQFLVPLNN